MQVIEVVASDDIKAAAWIGPRLLPFNSYKAGSVVPGGFDAYARIDNERAGVMPPGAARRLIAILVRHTPPHEVLRLALWRGYGPMPRPPPMRTVRRPRIGPAPPHASAPPPPHPE